MLRNVLFCASLALAITLTAGCKKDEKKESGKVDLDSVVGIYRGTETITYKETSALNTKKETSVIVKKGDGILADFTIEGKPTKVESNKDGKLVLKYKLGTGEAVISGSELTYSVDFSIRKEEFKGKKE